MLACSKCGFQDRNPFHQGAGGPAPAAFAYPPVAPGQVPYAYTVVQQAQAGVSPEAKSAETMALTFGLISLVGGFLLVLPLFLGPVAIVYGHRANNLGGNGTPGLVMGWIATGLLILGVLAVIFFFFVIFSLFGRVEMAPVS